MADEGIGKGLSETGLEVMFLMTPHSIDLNSVTWPHARETKPAVCPGGRGKWLGK